MAGADDQAPSGKVCPLCQRPADARYHPFCCKRCADVDLGRWLSQAYVLPGEDDNLSTDFADDDADETARRTKLQ